MLNTNFNERECDRNKGPLSWLAFFLRHRLYVFLALFLILFALLLSRETIENPLSRKNGEEIISSIHSGIAKTVLAGSLTNVHLGPLVAGDLTPHPTFTGSDRFKKMMEFIEKRHPNIDKIRKQFDEEGFIVFKPEIPEATLAAAAAFTEDVYRNCSVGSPPIGGAGCRDLHQDRYTDIPAIRDIAMNFHIHSMMAALHQHEPFPFQTLNYPLTSLARTHSDYVHFAAHPLPLMAASWVALIDVKPEAGPVFYHRGSHKLPHYNMQDFGLDNRHEHHLNYAKYQDVQFSAMERFGNRYEAVIPKGHCLIWSANLIHGGPEAKKERTLRLSQVTHFFFRGANYQWAPVASDVGKGKIEYYDTDAVAKKWDDNLPSEERRKISKFMGGDCETFTKDKPGVVSPCEMHSRPPRVFSKLLDHKSAQGESIM